MLSNWQKSACGCLRLLRYPRYLGGTDLGRTTGIGRVRFQGIRPHTCARDDTVSNSVSKAADNQDITTLIQNAIPVLVAGRQVLRSTAPKLYVPIRGVTFENRMELVKQLTPGQPVMAVRDPSNAFDPHAVKILTLDGQQLGFVPKQEAASIQLEVVFGVVTGVGQTSAGTWGAAVQLGYFLHEPTLDLLPVQEWPGTAMLQQACASKAWADLEGLTLQPLPRAHNLQQQQQQPTFAEVACAMTGIPASKHPVKPCPVWRFDAIAKKVQLLGMLPVAEALAAARQLDALKAMQREQAAFMLLSQMYGSSPWTAENLDKYVKYVMKRREQIIAENWQLDVSLLGF